MEENMDYKQELEKLRLRNAELEAENKELLGGQQLGDRLSRLEEMYQILAEERLELKAQQERELEEEKSKYINRVKEFGRKQGELWVNDQHPLQVKTTEKIEQMKNSYSEFVTETAKKRALNKVSRYEKFSKISNAISDNLGATKEAVHVVAISAKEAVSELTGPVTREIKKVPAIARKTIEETGKIATALANKTNALITKIADDYKARTKTTAIAFENVEEAPKRINVWEKARDSFKAFKEAKIEKRAELSRQLSDSARLEM